MKLRERGRAIWREFSRQMRDLNEACERDDPHISSMACLFLTIVIAFDSVLTHGFDL